MPTIFKIFIIIVGLHMLVIVALGPTYEVTCNLYRVIFSFKSYCRSPLLYNSRPDISLYQQWKEYPVPR